MLQGEQTGVPVGHSVPSAAPASITLLSSLFYHSLKGHHDGVFLSTGEQTMAEREWSPACQSATKYSLTYRQFARLETSPHAHKPYDARSPPTATLPFSCANKHTRAVAVRLRCEQQEEEEEAVEAWQAFAAAYPSVHPHCLSLPHRTWPSPAVHRPSAAAAAAEAEAKKPTGPHCTHTATSTSDLRVREVSERREGPRRQKCTEGVRRKRRHRHQ
ncbi:hypothetical protein IWZ03DRAFT_130376 [Phyllosticta citriasiana]|uniref:Uncharacterized protein n=1 Tax=Phyllosticta citriasiana TaxID=595635 RepID=A0ABR1KSZ7_9PEZI